MLAYLEKAMKQGKGRKVDGASAKRHLVKQKAVGSTPQAQVHGQEHTEHAPRTSKDSAQKGNVLIDEGMETPRGIEMETV